MNRTRTPTRPRSKPRRPRLSYREFSQEGPKANHDASVEQEWNLVEQGLVDPKDL